MLIAALADTHGHLPEVPECDLLVIAGDFTPVTNHTIDHQREWLDTEFRWWLEAAPASHIVSVAGNHDFIYDPEDTQMGRVIAYDGMEPARRDPPRLPWNYLQDEEADFGEPFARVYGTPWQPWFGGWAFNLRDHFHEAEVFAAVPSDLDVLVAHGPPYGQTDRTATGEYVGSKSLLDAIRAKQPRLVICGHIHEGGGLRRRIGDTLIVNASYVDALYDRRGGPEMIELD